MQLFGNVVATPVRKESKSTGRAYFEFRVGESQRGVDNSTTWYGVRVMKDVDPCLKKGDFVKVTGKLKVDFYVGRDGKPTGTLLVIAFEAAKISKPTVNNSECSTKEQPKAQQARQEQSSRATEQQVNWDSLV